MKFGDPLRPADINHLNFTKGQGLLPAIVQDADSRAVLMLGFMNPEALRATFDRRRVVFYSRSRRTLWEKGETSGHTLDLEAIYADCDHDTLLVSARPRGAACHFGTATCFGDLETIGGEPLDFLTRLETIIGQRIAASPEDSYTARLYAQGKLRLAQKVGEEALELALAAAAETDDKVIGESADLLFHVLVLLRSRAIPLAHVIAELEDRHTLLSES